MGLGVFRLRFIVQIWDWDLDFDHGIWDSTFKDSRFYVQSDRALRFAHQVFGAVVGLDEPTEVRVGVYIMWMDVHDKVTSNFTFAVVILTDIGPTCTQTVK